MTNQALTKRQADKVMALRTEAETHGDSKMVAICDAALAGDRASLTVCGVVVKVAKSAQAAADRKGPRKSAWAVPERTESQDVEDLTGLPERR